MHHPMLACKMCNQSIGKVKKSDREAREAHKMTTAKLKMQHTHYDYGLWCARNTYNFTIHIDWRQPRNDDFRI